MDFQRTSNITSWTRHFSFKARPKRNWLLFCVICMINGCAIFEQPKAGNGFQSGDYFVKEIQANEFTNVKQVRSLLKSSTQKKKGSFAKLIAEYDEQTAQFLLELAKTGGMVKTIENLANDDQEKTETFVYIALTLYPIDKTQITQSLINLSTLPTEGIESGALRAGIDSSVLLEASASQYPEDRIVPLFNSASITLYNQFKTNSAIPYFRESGESAWVQGHSLYWEPIQGALSGSIVRLQEDTQYELKVVIKEFDNIVDEKSYTFSTRSSEIPIDPEKVYYLSEIYTGGTLDLEQLNIAGTEQGWAKIIGDDVTVNGGTENDVAVNIGSQSYIVFERISVKGGRRHGVVSSKAHHLWFKDCEISNWGRDPIYFEDGIGFENEGDEKPINYDSGFFLERTGAVVIEDCHIHTPNGTANNWSSGHPVGPSAMLISANHPVKEYEGQYVIRNNRFYGSDSQRFNDVIQSLSNGRVFGGFIRDSAIHDNYLAYSNDDIIELDGGQSNVLFYNNHIEQGYCGVSAIPNMLGPSYIFNNYITNLGDDRQKAWAAIKLGGLLAAPAGITNIFGNLVVTSSNGVSASRFQNDYTYWAHIQNNIFVHDVYWGNMGFGILDREYFSESVIKNNFIFNTSMGEPILDSQVTSDFFDQGLVNEITASEIQAALNNFTFELPDSEIINNFSNTQTLDSSEASKRIVSQQPSLNFNNYTIDSFGKQDIDKQYVIGSQGNSITLSSNTWKQIRFKYDITQNTIVELDVTSTGIKEIAGISFEVNNTESSHRTFKFAGTQKYGITDFLLQNSNSAHVKIELGRYLKNKIDRIVFVHDDDRVSMSGSSMTISNLKIYEKNPDDDTEKDSAMSVTVGIDQEVN